MCRDLLTNSRAIFSALNPELERNAVENDCPAYAGALHSYLDNPQAGTLPAVLSRTHQYTIQANFQPALLSVIISNLRAAPNCTHYVVRGTRTGRTTLAPVHYFNMVNIDGTVYIADAWDGELTSQILRPASAGRSPRDLRDEPYYLNRMELTGRNALAFATQYTAVPR